MSQQAKVLTGLMERRAMQAAFDELTRAATLVELGQRAQEIADRGSAVLPALLARLDTEDPQLRGGLGFVAQRMDRELVVPALRAAVRTRDGSDRARVTALTILGRYLNEPLDDGLLTTIRDPDGVALQSLHELIAAMTDSPVAIVEYLNQLAQQPADVPAMLMAALPRLMPHPHLVTLLRMFAQGEDARLAQQALEHLGRTRTPEALLALIGLAETLPPDRAALATRGLRKIRLSGIQATPSLPATAWRTLLSPVDGTGTQTIWFRGQGDEALATTLVLVTRDPLGIQAAVGGDLLDEANIPPFVPEGEILSVPQAGERSPLMLLGVPFEMGRRTVQDALQLHWRNGSLPSLPYRFFSEIIWHYGPPTTPPDARPARDDRKQSVAALLDHPAFAGWFWHAPAAYHAAEQLGQRPSLAARTAAVDELARTAFSPTEADSYQRRLLAMADWLWLARQEEVAGLANAAAAELAAPPLDSHFLRRLIGIGLDIAAINLRSGYDMRRENKRQ
jgi:hypothetical protein